MHVDVTAERQTEESLRASELRFLQIAENIREVVFWLTDPAKNEVLYVSAAYEEIWGRSCKSVYASPRDWIDAIHPDDRERVLQAVQKQASGKYIEEYRIVRPDGAIRWVRDRAFPLVRNEREIYRIARLAEDITDSRRGAEELRESEHRFSDLLRNVDLVSLMLDRKARITYCNEYLLRLTGWQHEEVIGRNWSELFMPSGIDELKDVFAALIANQSEALHHESEILTRSGDRRLIRWNNSVLRSGAGDVIGMASIGEDITEQKRAEIRIRRVNRVYAVLSGINTAIMRVRDRDELFREACRIAVEVGAFRMAWIGVIDPQTLDGKVVAWHGGEEGYVDKIRLTARDGTSESERPACRALRQLRPVVCNDIATDPSVAPLRDELLRRGHKSIACLPLTVTGRPEAVLALFAGESDVFDDEEMQLLVDLGDNVSFALEHIAKEDNVKRLTRVHAVLTGINSAVVRIRDRQELFRESCRIAVEAGQLRLAWIGIVDSTREEILPVAFSGSEEGLLGVIRLSTKEDSARFGMAGRAIRDRAPAVSNDALADERTSHRKESARRGFRSFAMIPLIVDGAAIAVLGLHAAEAGFFNQDEMKLVMEIAGNIAFALEHIDKEEKVRRLTRVGAVLSGINALIVRARDREELFREACRIAVEEGEFLLAWIGIVDRSAMRIVPFASAGDDAGFLDEIRVRLSLIDDAPAGHGLAAMAVREKQAVIVNDVAANPRIRNKNAHANRGIRSVVNLPLLIADEPVAVFGLHAAEAGYFDEAEMKLLRELAGDIAFAVDHIEKQERLDYLAYYDVLTGLANRSLFLERLAPYMRSAASGGHKLALYLIDLERFKNINDTLGQPAGDALLRQVAEWLTHNVGDANLLARVGADHFAVVLPEVKQDADVARLVEKSMAAFAEHPFHLNDSIFRVAAKVGIALFPDDGADADTLFKHAEAALKKAKASGDRFLFYTQKMTETMAGKLTLETQLRQALDKEEFVLHYQPKVHLASGRLTGAEALIRWNDPRTGLVPPGRFIPILEETGLIHEVGRWALRKAIEDYLRWRTAGLAAVRIAVNVSSLQLRDHGFLGEIQRATGIDAHAAAGLELEITESMIMEDVEHSIASLQAIRAMGVRIAIDDFGTGFSSLSYLSRLPVDTLKIDRSFVLDMTATQGALALVSTIINLAHSLKLSVVAEGVETEEQSRLLVLLNCDEMQGYLFSKPVPREIFETRFLVPPASG